MSKLSSVKNDKTLIITCEEDQNEVRKIADSAKSLYNAELLLTGILQQKLKLESYPFHLIFVYYVSVLFLFLFWRSEAHNLEGWKIYRITAPLVQEIL